MTKLHSPPRRDQTVARERLAVISGNVVDQAQLHGYIQRIEELGLELLTVEQLNESR